MIQSFGQDLVSRITGLTRRQLEYWDEIGVVRPSVAEWEPRMPRLYSFRDLIKLKVAAEMRRRRMLPSQIKRSMEQLEERGFEDPLLTLQFVADPDGTQVFYWHPEMGPMSARHVDQRAEVFELNLRDLRTGLEDTIANLTRREPGKIAKVRSVQGSAPVIAGTRVPTAKIALLETEGWDVDRILAAFPHLTREDVEAALTYERRDQRRSA